MLYSELLPYIENKLTSGGIPKEDAKTEAKVIASDIGEIQIGSLLANPNTEIMPGRLNAINKTINTRIFERIPLQYLVPMWEWYNVKLKLVTGVLCPRQETEILIDIIADFIKENGIEKPAILDLCTGSGNIAIALKKMFPESTIYAVENSTLAIPTFKFNCNYNNVEINFVQGSVLEQSTLVKFIDRHGAPIAFDIIVSNPPYLTKLEMNTLQPELKHEPDVALYGGIDGLDFYRSISTVWKDNLKKDGMILYEVGQEQAKEVRRILNKAGYKDFKTHKDLMDNDRAVSAINRE
jgi:release factor glutamine methyltransferase